ncbi:MAG: outer membrane lipoprotein-sorting protein [Deltaproteobacteria bacterium]|nr:outer membrane lipoprotein-sorting protein [Deltaproteobacteria bacterium]MBT4264814.1 outer membrane lipoprotein-sorting protein [Deltaproteobacteria bacterium]MBT4639782.1 outer membrane lipoprotein-sorting protein [Deltaproteobacteria bacterium]MBT6615983.1 outer membrane lipoprotein-sorting protein [Deltaproteobacteria bacterium]MBT7153127.1 outer membrane lipoprotein-sorting protein [Deltaproteobacteria bacterium]
MLAKKGQKWTIRIFTFVFLSAFMWPGVLLCAEEMTALEVMQRADDRDDGETSTSEMTMILIDKRNNQRVRKMKSLRKDYGKDLKSISFFLSPADVRNTAFLSYDWDDENKEDDNWLYLPALRKVKRISSGNKKDSFMGSDFSYADMNGFKLSEWEYKFRKKSEKVDGFDCWVIEGTPKKEKRKKVINETGYLKNIAWISKEHFMTIRSKLYVKKGKKIKYFMASEIVKIQGIWTAKKLTMKTTKKKRMEHMTVLLFDNLVYNKGVEDTVFTTQRMEQGI